MNLNVLIKGVIIYLIFIIGVAIISEYICLRTNHRRVDADISSEEKIDQFLAELKKMYMKKINQEQFADYSDFQKSDSLEDRILCEVAKKLDGFPVEKILNSHSNSEVTMGQLYSQLNPVNNYPNTSRYIKTEIPKSSSPSETFKFPTTEKVSVDSRFIFSVPAFDTAASQFASISLK